jgi:PKD repeat protein
MKLQQYVLACFVLVIACSVCAIPATADLKDVPWKGAVILGERGLDITTAVGGYDYIGFWNGDLDPTPDRQIDLSGYVLDNFDILGEDFIQTAGMGFWYRYTPGVTPAGSDQAFQVLPATANVRVLDLFYDTDITNGAARLGNNLDLKIENTTLQFIQKRDTGATFNCDLKVYNPSMVEYAYLWTPEPDDSQKPLFELPMETSPFYWSSLSGSGSDDYYSWETGKQDSLNYNVYSYGTYTAILTCTENGLNFTSAPVTVTLYEDKLNLIIQPTPIIRGNKTYTTIQGVPNTPYVIWVKDCSGSLTGAPCLQPPMIVDGQDFVYFEEYQDCPIAETKFECDGCIKTIWDTIPHAPDNGKYYYAVVVTDENGERTIEWSTTVDTKPGTFIFRVQPWEPWFCCTEGNPAPFNPYLPYVEKPLTVNKGVVTFQTYVYGQPNTTAYLGETVRISGTNTDSRITYLMLRGPCQSCNGTDMMAEGEVVTGIADTFTVVPVKPDGTWEYIWYTKYLPIDLGEYTIYAASKPDDAQSLEGIPCDECFSIKASCAAWTKHPFIFLEPTIIADITPKVVRIECCEEPPIVVSGRATGIMSDSSDPYYDMDQGRWYEYYHPVPIAFWVFGENKVAGQKYIFDVVEVDCPGGTFSFDITDYMNALLLEPGQYKVIVQHPMYNHKLDIIPDKGTEGWLDWWCWFYGYTCSGDNDCPCDQCVELGWWHDDCCDVCCDQGLWTCCGVYTYETNREFVVSASPVRWSKLFQIDGTGRLVGTQASNALISGFGDPIIDDKILVLNFKVESNTALTADFSGTPVSGSAPLTVQFTDISTGTPSSWLWFFGDGSTSTDQNPSHIYLEAGTYAVTLQVSNSGGSSATTKANYIAVSGVSPTVTPTTPPISGSTINLYTGWNFVSTPRTLADSHNTIGTVFAGVTDRPVYLYDAETGMWQILGNSSLFKPLDGIWIYSTGTKTAPLTFKNDPLATPPTKLVFSGWNAIGFSDVTPAAAKDTLQSVSAQWVSAIGFSASSQSYESSIIKGGSGSHADTNPMYPTKGYWLFMNADGTLAAISA